MTNDSRNTSINKKFVSLILKKNAGNRRLRKDFDENSPFHRSLSLYMIFILSIAQITKTEVSLTKPNKYVCFITNANQKSNLIYNWYNGLKIADERLLVY